MRYRALFLAAFASLGVFLLTACTSSEAEIAQDARTEFSGNTGAADAADPDSAAGQQDLFSDQGADAGAGAADDPTPADVAGGETASGTETDLSPARTETPDAQDGASQEGSADGAAVEDIWSGTYVSDRESVTVSLIDAKSFSFSFANSGIASVAEIDGATAVYRGDDHHIVVFEMNEGVLNITVSSEEDYDASASPLNGTYVRQTMTSDTESGEGET